MHKLENVTTIGERIRFLRQVIHKVTQQELADATGISRGNLSNYEKDRFKPASDAILAIANYFNVSTDWLLTGKESLNSKTNIYNPHNNSMVLSNREIELINLFRKLKNDDKLKIEGMLELKLSEYDTLKK
ncbi:helix-turn-helix domain protein [Clostridium sp. DL-VIII]|uniref:helix-turn-helix domain-containing protein n=1 Tax=Clostridium sp. DL-VIII TaxID=641107 RepID=UPI00023B03D7|nr:helix-turn-helix domain-containing protein [Clostridium sp. DL-VIII]EHJ02388.1 helix-turn-helix domain protein [Clostridium sp. DL-VIII]